MLQGKNIVIGVTGGIACFKACEIVGKLKKLGAEVDVIMTPNATQFVTPLTFETLSKRPVAVDTFSREQPWEVEHISLAKKADLMVIAPATANFIAKAACGIADDMLTTTYLACKARKIICPAMNTAMLNAEATKRNISELVNRGDLFVNSEIGMLACGDVGDGRLADPEVIVKAILKELLPRRDLLGKTVVITAGGTEESIDAVRVITNHSSGKMGAELAKAAKIRGASVKVIAGRVSVDMPSGVDVVKVTTTEEMAAEVIKNREADYFIMAAAPSDYRVKNKSANKIKAKELTLELVKNIDIAQEVGKIKKGKLVIFSAETENLINNATAKLINKGADLVVANDVGLEGAGFGTDTNIVTLIDKNGVRADYGKLPKSDVADIIIDAMVRL